jgi:lysophospholipase L1-like esterase
MNDNGDIKIAFFGDSITYGQGVSPYKTWVTRLSSDFETWLGNKIVVSNCGINGNTTRQALERMPYDVQSHGVDIIFIQFGLNDCNYWDSDGGLPRVSPKAFEANLYEIAERSRTFGAKLIFMHTNHPTNKKMNKPDADYQENNKFYNIITRKVANSLDDVILVDFEKECESLIASGRYTVEDILLKDGLHLSQIGHDIYYDTLHPLVKNCISTFIENRKFVMV